VRVSPEDEMVAWEIFTRHPDKVTGLGWVTACEGDRYSGTPAVASAPAPRYRRFRAASGCSETGHSPARSPWLLAPGAPPPPWPERPAHSRPSRRRGAPARKLVNASPARSVLCSPPHGGIPNGAKEVIQILGPALTEATPLSIAFADRPATSDWRADHKGNRRASRNITGSGGTMRS